MKKFLLSLVALIGAVSVNAQNNLYIEVGESDNTANIPVNIILDTDVELSGLQASFALPNGLGFDAFKKVKRRYVTINTDLWPYDDANDDYAEAYYTFYENAKEFATASKPNDLLISLTNGTTTNKIPAVKNGILGTFYFDGSTLTDGSYEVTQYTATLFPDAKTRIDIDSRDSDDDDVKASFTIQDGKVTGTSTAINEINANGDAAKGIYNIAGQRLNTLQKGLNIVDGKKVYVK